YFNSWGIRKHKIESEYLKVQNEIADQIFNLSIKTRSGDLTESPAYKLAHWNPFKDEPADWFDPEWMFGVKYGFDIVIGNPPYGSTIPDRDYIVKNYKYYETRKNSASLFMELGGTLAKQKGIVCYIVPKSLTFSSSWEKPRSMISDVYKLLKVIDVSKAFEEVLLEQVIIMYANSYLEDIGDYSFVTGEGWGNKIVHFDAVSKRLIKRLNIIPIYADLQKIRINEKLAANSILLGEICDIFRGLPIQKHVSSNGIKCIRGRDIGKFKINRDLDKVDTSRINSRKLIMILRQKIVSQNIVAHVTKPFDRLVIMAAVDNEGLPTMDTVMNILPVNSRFNMYYLTGILNSRLSEWFFYWFVYNRAIRTMHFDKDYMGRLPIKDVDKTIQKSIVDKAIVLENLSGAVNATQNTKEKAFKKILREIDEIVFELYELTSREIEIIMERSCFQQ
ncbi:MAG: Eco57I restriction-modification methylase domain-containing protein, partial [Candidatus Heimdallarchaeaceae archaeon]